MTQDNSILWLCRTYNWQKPSGNFHSNPLVYSVLAKSQGGNNVIPKSFTCTWIIWKQCSLDVIARRDTQ
jgi:hypothetical protein